MKGRRLENAVDGANNIIDNVAKHIRVGNDQPVPKHKGERGLILFFPFFVIACLCAFIVSVFYSDTITFPKIIELLCLSFVFGFTILGIPCFYLMPKGAFSKFGVTLGAAIMTIILSYACYKMGDNYFADAVHGILDYFDLEFEGTMEIVIGFLGTYAIVLFTPIGVISIISAYLCRYLPDVFESINYHSSRGERGMGEWFFIVPDIIDVKRTVISYNESNHEFNLWNALRIIRYQFILGLLISSILFVNPFFLDVMNWTTMLAITMMLSMFTPALVLPWLIVRNVNARVESDAPRPYYLWKGAKKRLFSTFFGLGALMMMFLLSLYLDNDVHDIVRTYLNFLIPLMVTSIVYACLYTNNFEKKDNKTICQRFDEIER